MSTKFKVGDIVQFHPEAIRSWKKSNNSWWKEYGFQLNDHFVVMNPANSWSVQCHLLNFPERTCGLSDFKWQVVTERDPYYKVIAKIKYLNDRWKERKNATV